MATTAAHTQDIDTLNDKIKDIRVAMMTTALPDGSLRSRPMATQDAESDGDLWFFTQAETPKVDEVQRHEQVNLSYAKPDDNLYVSVSGVGELVFDRAKMQELWKPFLKAWFPQGLDDPQLALLRVRVESAEYWDAPSGKMVQVVAMAKALVGGAPADPGEHAKLTLK
jgi:general stress protein 26